MRSFLHKDNFVSLVKNKIMKKSALIALLFPLCAATAQTTDDFVPQEMAWGTYLPITVGSSLAFPKMAVASAGEVVIAGNTFQNENTAVELQLITENAHQSELNGGQDGILYVFNADGTVKFGTYFGGEGEERIRDVKTDNDGNIYISGRTYSYNNITTPGADKETYTGYMRPPLLIENPIGGAPIEIGVEMPIADGFLAKFDSEGNLLWSTYVAGHRGGGSTNVNIGASGIYVSGATLSIQDFTTPGVFQPDWPSDVPQEASVGFIQPAVPFLAKYSFDGELLWRSYFYFENTGQIIGDISSGDMCLDGDGNIYSLQAGGVVKINSDGQFFEEYALPQSAQRYHQIHCHGGNFYIVGVTEEVNFGTPGTFRPQKPVGDTIVNEQFFITKYNPNFQTLWTTFLPNNNHSFQGTGHRDVIIDQNDNVYLSNYTIEENLGTPGVFQQEKNGFYNAYAMRLNSSGALDWFTYFGHSSAGGGVIDLDSNQALYGLVYSQGEENVVNENGLFSNPDEITPYTVNNYRAHLMKLVKSKSSSTDDFLKGKINVYPNPAKDILNIDLSDELLSNPLSYALYDLLGKQIANGSLDVSQNHQINVSNLATGVYLLKITDQATQASQQFKIIKE